MVSTMMSAEDESCLALERSRYRPAVIAVVVTLVIGYAFMVLCVAFRYPKRVASLGAGKDSVSVFITHDVSAFECLTLGLFREMDDSFGVAVEYSNTFGRRKRVQVEGSVGNYEHQLEPQRLEGTEKFIVVDYGSGEIRIDRRTGEISP